MRLVIEQGGVKRAIDAPFSMCADNDSLAALIEALEDEVARRERRWVVYGWFDIHPRLPLAISSPPREWAES